MSLVFYKIILIKNKCTRRTKPKRETS